MNLRFFFLFSSLCFTYAQAHAECHWTNDHLTGTSYCVSSKGFPHKVQGITSPSACVPNCDGQGRQGEQNNLYPPDDE